MKVQGTTANYGQPIGILMLETAFPRIPGDIGNATTFDFPVVYRTVRGANYDTVVGTSQRALIQELIAGGRALQTAGCRAVFTSCGFLAAFQREVAAGLDVPFLSSSLMQMKYVYDLLPAGRKVGVLTAFEKDLTRRHFQGVGADEVPRAVVGLEGTYFGDFLKHGPLELDVEQARRDMAAITRKLLRQEPHIGAIVLECTNMPPFATAVAEVAKVPVFDITSLVNYVEKGIVRQTFQGFL